MESCKTTTKVELKNMNTIIENITRIIMIPPTTHRELLYIEMGLLDMESTIKLNRINYANRVAKTKKDSLGKITKSTHKQSWKEVIGKISNDIGITMENKV